MKILVTGANGQLGSELRLLSFNQSHHKWIFTNTQQLNLSDLQRLESNISKIAPCLIINCAAYTSVDKAESENELSNVLNFKAVDLISKWSSNNNKKLIHISTDYVFDGSSVTPLKECVLASPINFYGFTKLKGERICLKNDLNSIIIRTSWLYSSFGNNFVKTMINLMKKRDSLNVINDQIGSPTYALDLAEAILTIINHKKWIPGLYHYSNKGTISWFDFANDIKHLSNFKIQIKEISTKEYPTAAKRPKYSLLDKTKIQNTYNVKVPFYKDSLKKCLKILTL
ncbi:dTDP-4-dehydrorhamnose reductase [Flavobacteriaceae bacterium]|nr:dTDP-4-dehydrorhamnose reductase [Flavobacteriaceae bacterium]